MDIRGKCDGLTADPAHHRVIATVNEDAHSSVYTIDPWAAPACQVHHYSCSRPLPSRGGTERLIPAITPAPPNTVRSEYLTL